MINISFAPNLKEITGKNTAIVSITKQKENEVLRLPSGQKSLAIGAGERKKMTHRKLILLSRQIIAMAKANKIKKIALNFSDFAFPQLKLNNQQLAELLATNIEMSNYDFVRYKTKPKDGWNFIKDIIVAGKINAAIKKGIEKGQIIGQEVNNCRNLSNTPGGEMTPKLLACEAEIAIKNTSAEINTLNKAEISKLKMGGVLGVSLGSKEEPKFIILEYWGAGKPRAKQKKVPTKQKPIVLVGKGVTFDTGGLNLKPSGHIYEMHMDMSGGAAVISAVATVAKLKLKKNVIGLIPAVENMPSGSSYRPGDILITMSGKTIEVLNTDAEGRIILADALTYAKKYNPRMVIDIATLTGAAAVALGQRAIALFTKKQNLENIFREIGESSGDYVWPLPLWDEYYQDIKGTFGDISNSPKTRYGGAITAAVFLYQFAKDYRWVHLDIAPRMTSTEDEHLAKGSAGAPVRLLTKLIERY